MPKALAHIADRTFTFAGSTVSRRRLCKPVVQRHGNATIQRAIDAGRPVTVKFLRAEKSWKAYVSVDDRSEMKRRLLWRHAWR